MRRVCVVGFALFAFVLTNAHATLHHTEDPLAVPVNAKGEPEPLPFDEFGRRRLVLINTGNEKWPLEMVDPNDATKRRKSDRGIVKDRIDKRLKSRDRDQNESVSLAVDLLRFGKPDEADGALTGKQRQGYLGSITLAHIAATQSDPTEPKSRNWSRALNFLLIANEEVPPKSFPGLSPQQLAWQLKLNQTTLMKFIMLRRDESRGKRPTPEDELPDAIYTANFNNAAGVYEPGVLTPAEQAKIPPDAIATVQQLVLWFPHETRLYWLLAELYAAKGEYAAARKIMDECVSSLGYSNRKVLMQHREAVTRAANEKGSAPDDPLLAGDDTKPTAPVEPPPPITLGAVWIYFGIVAVIAIYALIRKLTKRPQLPKTRNAAG